MPLINLSSLALPVKAFVNNGNAGAPGGVANELMISELVGKYATLVKLGVVFSAYATLTAPVIFSTAAGTGGPLLWNKPSSNIDAHILGVGFSSSVVTTVAGGLGLTGNGGQSVAPGTTTAIDASGNMLIGGKTSGCNVYRIGTPANAGAQLFPFAQFHTGALTVDTTLLTWIDLGGAMIVPPGCWASPAGTATLTTLQVQIGLLWAELPD
ncbi:MAG TPA: hypothetical protein VGZ90_13315 [Puia sp.]|jgi:hypothetical protein|nr:hypothetical protein [Puia sp.]